MKSISVSSFTMAMWLVAKGFQPTSAIVNPARGGRADFIFPAEAKDAWAEYNVAKAQLDLIAQKAGGRS